MEEDATLEFRLLGPLVVQRGGSDVPIAANKHRALLAILLLRAGEIVSTDALIDALWEREPPPTAATALQGYVSQVRKMIEPVRGRGEPPRVLVTHPAGYQLRLARSQLDLHVFEDMLGRARALRSAGDESRALTTLDEALALWRGRPLADFAYDAFAQIATTRLEELRLVAMEDRMDVLLALGRHDEVIPELDVLIAEHPLRERLRAQSMLALYRARRQGEALAVYQETRRVLIEELGIDPSPSLQQLERDVLAQAPGLEVAAADVSVRPAGTLTLLFTDIEGSTQLVRELGDEYASLLAEYKAVLRNVARDNGGTEVDTQGDALFIVFERARDACVTAVAAARAYERHELNRVRELRVRFGLHTGEPAQTSSGYVGIDVHRTSRICSAAHGGQIVVSRSTRDLAAAAELDGASFIELGEYFLKDIEEPEQLFQLVHADLPSDFPPLRADALASDASPVSRSVLIAGADIVDIDALIQFAEPLARSKHPHGLIVAGLADPEGAEGRSLREWTHRLKERQALLERRRIAVRTAAFTSDNRGDDIVRLASEQDVDLVLLAHSSPDGRDIPDDVRFVLDAAPSDVALYFRGSPGDGAVALPFAGGEHDWAALELSAWIALAAGVPLMLLGVEADRGGRDASRLLASASLAVQAVLGISAEPQLVPRGHEAILAIAAGACAIVAGLGDRWQGEGYGASRAALAREAEVPVLLVRRGVRPGGLAPSSSVTRYTWSLGPGTLGGRG